MACYIVSIIFYIIFYIIRHNFHDYNLLFNSVFHLHFFSIISSKLIWICRRIIEIIILFLPKILGATFYNKLSYYNKLSFTINFLLKRDLFYGGKTFVTSNVSRRDILPADACENLKPASSFVVFLERKGRSDDSICVVMRRSCSYQSIAKYPV